jgi:hypothetical protein
MPHALAIRSSSKKRTKLQLGNEASRDAANFSLLATRSPLLPFALLRITCLIVSSSATSAATA